ncbi:MAG: hypothetical protein SH857_07695 [Chitinophagales bacterium]|nr:hypothetical protein [Chitinophagales bacterium]
MKTKTIFLSAFLIFASALCLRAQGTYEYATVTYSWKGANIYYIGISTGDNYTETKVQSKFESKGPFTDLTP